MSRMAPVPIEECHERELRQTLEHFVKTLGFVPNSLLTMQRVPAIAKAVVQLNKAVFDPAGRVDLGLKRLVAHMASYAAGCQYCRAHTTVSATRHGIADEKMSAIYEYQTSPVSCSRPQSKARPAGQVEVSQRIYPMPRRCRPDDVADTVLFLSSNEAA
jgi:alkylhydroperoxidase family enzyme